MVFIAMINTCSVDNDIDIIKDKVAIIEERVVNHSLNSDGASLAR